MRKLLILPIAAYKLALSPFLGRRCRFHPSCADYAMEAIERHGALGGGWMAVKRIARCHPWNEGGEDPVPGRRTDTRTRIGAEQNDYV